MFLISFLNSLLSSYQTRQQRIIILPHVRKHALLTTFHPIFQENRVPAAILSHGIQRTVAEQAIEFFLRHAGMTWKKLTFPVLEKRIISLRRRCDRFVHRSNPLSLHKSKQQIIRLHRSQANKNRIHLFPLLVKSVALFCANCICDSIRIHGFNPGFLFFVHILFKILLK